jgi:DNA adenine methylase
MSIFAPHKLRPLIKCHGGKGYLARRIVAQLPGHSTYVEPYAGGLSVLLNKEPAPVEVAGDVYRGLVDLYTALQVMPEELITLARSLPYDGATFESLRGEDESGDLLASAIHTLVRHRFSRGGLGKDFAWSERLRGGQPGDKNGWETILKELPRIADRLKDVTLRHQDALETIREFDGPEAVMYLDPPYHPSAISTPSAWRHPLDDAGHRRLLDLITSAEIKGKVALSGYPCALYDTMLEGWKVVAFDMPHHASQSRSKQRRAETIWMNF